MNPGPADKHQALHIDRKRYVGARPGRRHFRAVYRAIKRIALDGHSAGFADQAFELNARGKLRRFRAGIVVNLFLHHRAVEVVGAKTQCDLRDAGVSMIQYALM